MKNVEKKTKVAIVKKYYDEEYAIESTANKLKSMFDLTIHKIVRNEENDKFMEKAAMERISKEYGISEKMIDKIIDEEEEDFYNEVGPYKREEGL